MTDTGRPPTPPHPDPIATARAAAYTQAKAELNTPLALETYRQAASGRGLTGEHIDMLADAIDPTRLLSPSGEVDFDKITRLLDATTGTPTYPTA